MRRLGAVSLSVAVASGSVGNRSLPLSVLFYLEKINACGLLRSVNSCYGLERFQINNLDCAGFSADPFNRNECVTIVRRYYGSVNDLPFCRHSGKLAP